MVYITMLPKSVSPTETDEIWLDATTFASAPYEHQREVRSGRERWRVYAEAGPWQYGPPPTD